MGLLANPVVVQLLHQLLCVDYLNSASIDFASSKALGSKPSVNQA
jgi:hypothetical protein